MNASASNPAQAQKQPAALTARRAPRPHLGLKCLLLDLQLVHARLQRRDRGLLRRPLRRLGLQRAQRLHLLVRPLRLLSKPAGARGRARGEGEKGAGQAQRASGAAARGRLPASSARVASPGRAGRMPVQRRSPGCPALLPPYVGLVHFTPQVFEKIVELGGGLEAAAAQGAAPVLLGLLRAHRRRRRRSNEAGRARRTAAGAPAARACQRTTATRAPLPGAHGQLHSHPLGSRLQRRGGPLGTVHLLQLAAADLSHRTRHTAQPQIRSRRPNPAAPRRPTSPGGPFPLATQRVGLPHGRSRPSWP